MSAFEYVTVLGLLVAAYFAGKARGYDEAFNLLRAPQRELQRWLDLVRAREGPDA